MESNELLQAERTSQNPSDWIGYPVKKPLFTHQQRAANMALLTFGFDPQTKHFTPMNGNKGFGFLFEMGCGKTLTAIAVMGALFKFGRIKKVLVVAPSSVCGVWPTEMQENADFPFRTAVMLGDKSKRIETLNKLSRSKSNQDLQMAIINYESAWREGIFEALTEWKPDLVIADESQRIKTHSASQSKAMHKLGDAATYKIILSGTPVQNSAIDIFSQYRFLDPSVFGKRFYAFRSRYAVMGGFENHQIVGYKNMDELIQKAHSIAYRVTKAEALDLPEQTFENRIIELSGSERRIYDQLERNSYAQLENGDKVSATVVLTKLMRLQQLTGGFLCADGSGIPQQVNHAKIDALMDIVRDCVDCGQKLVVFARFTPEIDLIADSLKQAKINYGVIDGRTPVEHKVGRTTELEVLSRSEIVEDFQTNQDTQVFVAQIQTAGLGITLHAASIAVFYSLDFNYANYAQALARIHRIGQRHPCTYIHLLAENTIDEQVLDALKNKSDIARSIVDNWRNFFKTI